MTDVMIATAAISVGTFLIRASFLLSRGNAERQVSARTERWLRMIPPAALGSIVALQLSDPGGSTGLVARLLAATIAVVVTRMRANLAFALVAGMVTVVIFDAVLS